MSNVQFIQVQAEWVFVTSHKSQVTNKKLNFNLDWGEREKVPTAKATRVTAHHVDTLTLSLFDTRHPPPRLSRHHAMHNMPPSRHPPCDLRPDCRRWRLLTRQSDVLNHTTDVDVARLMIGNMEDESSTQESSGCLRSSHLK